MTIIHFQDLSDGLEAKPIRVINDTGKIDVQMDGFRYIEYNFNETISWNVVCQCGNNCIDHDNCTCWQYSPYQIKSDGYRHKRLHALVPLGIYECSRRCGCDDRCWNYVVQEPIKHNFEVFLTEERGWGVRCRNDLPSGAFISCYVGDVLSERSSDERAEQHGDMYFASLDIFKGTDYEPPTKKRRLAENESVRKQTARKTRKITKTTKSTKNSRAAVAAVAANAPKTARTTKTSRAAAASAAAVAAEAANAAKVARTTKTSRAAAASAASAAAAAPDAAEAVAKTAEAAKAAKARNRIFVIDANISGNFSRFINV